jgi:hypothetical protein
VRRVALLVAAASIAHGGCYPSPEAQPSWISTLIPKLRCGLTLDEVRGLTDREIIDLGGGHSFFGTHRISTTWHEVWLGFDDQRLRSVAWGAAEDSKSSRLSPKSDLCSGDLNFVLTMSWTEAFVGSTVYLDDRLVAESARVPPPLELSEGRHEIRIEKHGFRTIVRELVLTSSDRGDQEIRFGGEDLIPI